MTTNPSAATALPRKHHDIVTKAIRRWSDQDVVDATTATRLEASIAAARFDWQRTARYAFIAAIACFAIAVSALLADRILMELLMRIFDAPAFVKCGFFAALSAGIFAFALAQRRRPPERTYGNEAVFFLGVLALAASIWFFGAAIDNGSGHYSVLFLIATLLYGLLGLWFPSKLVWVFGLLSLGSWMGTETGYWSGHGAYFLGMNQPLRFVLFGAAMTLLGVAGMHANFGPETSDARRRLVAMSPQTRVIGLLYLFIALWLLSIFGNYGDLGRWHHVHQIELAHWSLLFGAAAIGAIAYGLRHDDAVMRGFGLTFLFINLYTRFFEYFWDSIHKAVFFAILAVSFWALGTRAEAIWNVGRKAGTPEVAPRRIPVAQGG